MAAIPDPSQGQPSPASTRKVGVVEAYRRGWRTMTGRFGILLGLLLLMLVINSPPSIYSAITGAALEPGATPGVDQLITEYAIASVYGLLVSAPVSYGLFYAYLRAARGAQPELRDLFEGLRHYGAAVVAAVLTGVLTTVGFLLFIIPGIVALVRLSFVPFLVTDAGLGGVDAVKESWRRTRGHGWRILGFGLVAIPIVLGGLLLFIVGVIPAMLWVYAGFASFYDGATDDAQTPSTPPGDGGGDRPRTEATPPSTTPATGARVDPSKRRPE